jgi:hypothetical protein
MSSFPRFLANATRQNLAQRGAFATFAARLKPYRNVRAREPEPKPVLLSRQLEKTAICYQTPSYNARHFAYIQKSQTPIDVQPMNSDDRNGANLRPYLEAVLMATAYPRSPARRSNRLSVHNTEASQSTRSDLGTLYQKLLGLRLDLVHGVMPRAERITLTAGDLEHLLAELDAAIAVARDIASTDSRSSPRNPAPGRTRAQ